MHKQVLATVGGRDEAESLRGVEPLDGALLFAAGAGGRWLSLLLLLLLLLRGLPLARHRRLLGRRARFWLLLRLLLLHVDGRRRLARLCHFGWLFCLWAEEQANGKSRL